MAESIVDSNVGLLKAILMEFLIIMVDMVEIIWELLDKSYRKTLRKKSFSDGLYNVNVTEDGRTLHWGGGITVDGKRIPLYVDENGNRYYLDDSGNEVYLNSFTKII